jgi:hypothetical protein
VEENILVVRGKRLYVADGGAFGVVFLVQGLRKCGFLELGGKLGVFF